MKVTVFLAACLHLLGLAVQANPDCPSSQDTSVLLAGNSPGSIQSPGYPSYYDSNLQCYWRIRAMDSSKVIKLEVKDARLDGDCDPDSDRLEAFEGFEVLDNKRLMLVCYKDLPYVFFNGPEMLVYFGTDKWGGYKGFKLSYSQVDKSEAETTPRFCSHIDNPAVPAFDEERELRSPNYPDGNPGTRKCFWIFEASPDHVVKLTVKHANIQIQFMKDEVFVLDGPTIYSPQLGLISGTRTPIFYSSGRFLSVAMDNSAAALSSGFLLGYRQIPASERPREGAASLEIILPCVFGALALLSICCYCCCCRKKKSSKSSSSAQAAAPVTWSPANGVEMTSHERGGPQWQQSGPSPGNLQGYANAHPYPQNPPYPEKPTYPEDPTYPQNPTYPENPPYPQNPRYPENTPYPEKSAYPQNPSFPQNPPYPQYPSYQAMHAGSGGQAYPAASYHPEKRHDGPEEVSHSKQSPYPEKSPYPTQDPSPPPMPYPPGSGNPGATPYSGYYNDQRDQQGYPPQSDSKEGGVPGYPEWHGVPTGDPTAPSNARYSPTPPVEEGESGTPLLYPSQEAGGWNERKAKEY